jgi:hypothetical protein
MLTIDFQPSRKLNHTPIYANYLKNQPEHLYYTNEGEAGTFKIDHHPARR